MLKELLSADQKITSLRCTAQAGDTAYGEYSKPGTLYPVGDAAYGLLTEGRRKALIRAGEEYLNFDWPSLPAALYMEFSRNGNRKNYETPYFLRRTALSALTAAECVENRGRFLPDIVNGIICICEESGWTIPAHNTYIRDTKQFPLPRTDRPILDLFACETGAVLASVHALLSDVLSAIDPEIPARIERELQRRIIVPYLTDFFWFMGNDKEPTNNWTVWCTQNVLYSVFLIPHPDEVYRQVLRQALRSCDCFINEYGDDGCCSEGASYYHHAGLCLYTCMDLMNQITGGAFLPAFREEKIRNIANYIMKVHVSGEYFLNYADCDLKPGLCGVKEYLFAKATGQEDMMRFASRQFQLKREKYGDDIGGRDVFDILLEAFTEEEALGYAADTPNVPGIEGGRAEEKGRNAAGVPNASEMHTCFKKRVSFPSIGVYAAEGERLYLSVKSGDTTGSHKHNDVGSFIVYADGKPLLIDPGVPTYTRETFSEKRYEIWTMQSQYHNLPVICGFGERGDLRHIPGKYCAKDLEIRMTEDRYLHRMELAGAYDENAPIRSYIRSIDFTPAGGIEVCEKLELTPGTLPDWTFCFMSEQEPVCMPEKNMLSQEQQMDSQELQILRIGSLGKIRFMDPAESINTEWIDTSDQRLQRSWKKGIYRTLVHVIDAFEFKYEITVE